MKFSIITTCFNSASTIRETIESILMQNGDFEIEYIVTDAGSKDGTVEIVNEFIKNNSNPKIKITLYSVPGLNQSEGINYGFEKSAGDILAFINADDTYLPGSFEKVHKEFAGNKAHWVTGFCRVINGEGKEISKPITKYKNFFLSIHSYFLLLIENYISQPATFWSREVYEKIGEISKTENYVMDYDFWLRIGQKYRLKVVKEYLATFRRTPNTKSNKGFYKQFKDDMRVANKYSKITKNYLSIPFKFLSYLKTILIYSFIIK